MVGFLFFFQGSPSSSEVKLAEIEHLVVEVRSALNYQTDVLKEEIRALSVMHEIELYTTHTLARTCANFRIHKGSFSGKTLESTIY